MKPSPSLQPQTHPYNVPLIPTDLRHDETILQISDALEYLNKVADDIFKRIGNRVNENKKKLGSINERINNAQAKIYAIKGTNKATKIFSSAKYPAPDQMEQYKTLFEVEQSLREVKHAHRHITSKHSEVDDIVLKEKLQFYNVHLNNKKNKEGTANQTEGLGRLPRNVDSISSLLLFNTSENPYKKYIILDPLGVVTKTRKAELDEQDDGLAAAPSTIAYGDQFQRAQTESYFYIPVAGDVPEITVPEFLPELPGVAGDMLFSGELVGAPIAPSIPLPDLPDIGQELNGLPPIPGDIHPVPTSTPTPPHPVVPAPTAPPTTVPISGIPPPPPPPPLPAGDDLTPNEDTPLLTASGQATGRSQLLDSIVNSGGIEMLKKKKRNRPEQKEGIEPPPSAGEGDLFSELKVNLRRRRVGISDAKQPDADKQSSLFAPTSPLDAMKIMIPLSRPQSDSITSETYDDPEWSD